MIDQFYMFFSARASEFSGEKCLERTKGDLESRFLSFHSPQISAGLGPTFLSQALLISSSMNRLEQNKNRN